MHYIKPDICIVHLHGEAMLVSSNLDKIGATPGQHSTGDDIGYGGTDEDGTIDPEARVNPFGDTIFD